MKKFLFVILILSLIACAAPQATAPTSTVEATVTVSITPVPTATATEIPFAALTPEEQAAQYLAGKVQDVSELNLEQQKEFSIALAEQKNEIRGDNPVIYNGESGTFYIDPITGKFLPIDNGTTAKEQTIKMYIPRIIDDEGYTQVFLDGTWIKIEGSQNIKFDGDIKWPATEIVDSKWVTPENQDLLGLTIPEYMFKTNDGRQRSMVPIIILSKELGEINITGFGLTGTLTGYAINRNDPFSTRRIILTGSMGLFGDDLSARSTGELDELSSFWEKLQENTLYNLMYLTDQKTGFATTYPRSNGTEATTGYSGLESTNSTHQVITGQSESNKVVWIGGICLVIEGK